MSQAGARAADTEPVRSAVIDGVVSLALAHAAVLARSGRLKAAAAALEGVASLSPPDVRALDLLAKVRAQQGQLDAAERLWTRASGLREAGAFDAALNRVKLLRRRPKWFGAARVAAVACTLVVLLVVGARLIRGGAVPQAPALSGHVSRPVSAPAPLAEVKPATKDVVTLDLEAPGVTAVRREGGAVVTFAEGLFSEGTTLTTGGTKALKELGTRLGRVHGDATVVVTGCTDDVPVAPGRGYQDNAALGLARAAVVAERLRASSGWPAQRFFLGTTGGADGPYPNDSATSRMRNRTATIRVKTQESF